MGNRLNAYASIACLWLVLVMVACVSGNSGDTSSSEFRVAQVLPGADDELDALDSPVAVTFSSDVDPKTITAQTLRVMEVTGHQKVLGKVTYDPATRTAKFSPYAGWAPEAHYEATIHHRVQTSVGGKHLPGTFTWKFTAPAEPPQTFHFEPSDGETGVSPKTSIRVQFSELMDAATITGDTFQLLDANGSVVPSIVTAPLDGEVGHGSGHDVTRPPPRPLPLDSKAGHAILTPERALNPDTQYSVSLTSGIKSGKGVAFRGQEWRFTTAIGKSSTLLIGSALGDAATGVAVQGGYIYVLGVTSGALAGTNDNGEQDLFLTKRDAEGRELWMTQFGGPARDSAGKLFVANDGTAYVVGGSDLGAPSSKRQAVTDGVIYKISPTGQLLTEASLGSNGTMAWVASVISDGAGGIYVSGGFDGTLAGHVSRGGTDGFLANYDSNLNRIWLEVKGTAGDEGRDGNDIALGSSGEIFWVVSTEGDFNKPREPASALFNKKMVFRFDPVSRTFSPGWPIRVGGDDSRGIAGIGVDAAGAVLVGGSISLNTLGAKQDAPDSFIVKLDAATGAEIASFEWGANHKDEYMAMTIQPDGAIYLAGLVPGFAPKVLTPDGIWVEPIVINAYVTKVDFSSSSAREVWSSSLLSQGFASASGVVVSPQSGDLLVVGGAYGSFDGQAPAGDNDGFLAWLNSADGKVK